MIQTKSSGHAFVKNKHRFDVHKFIFLAVIFALPAINFLVFWVYLNISAVDFAFKIEMQDGSVHYSLQNFKALFEAIALPHSTFWIALRNTMLYWLTSVFSYLFAMIVGYFLFKKLPGHSAYRFLFYMPSLIAPTILVALFKQLIAANGPISLFYGNMEDVPRFLSSEEWAIWVCLFYSFFFGFGANLIVISGAMTQVDKSMLEAGKLDGVNMRQEMFRIMLPVIWPTVIAQIIGTVTGIFMSSGPILLLTNGAYETRTISFWIYEQVYTGANYYYSAAIGMFFALLAIPLTFFSRWLMRKVVPSNDGLEEK